MIRFSVLLWMAVIVAASFILYRVKYDVQALRAQVAEASRELAAEEEALRVANAEWAYLNRPQRLKELAAKHLDAMALKADQVAEIEAVPFAHKAVALAPKSNIQPVAMRGR